MGELGYDIEIYEKREVWGELKAVWRSKVWGITRNSYNLL